MSKGSTRRRSNSGRRGPAGRRGGVNWIVVVGVLGGLVLLIGLLLSVSRQSASIAGVQTFGTLPSGLHVNTQVDYPQQPPVGGEHYPAWQNCGIYDQPVEDELAVHALEHGAVWLAYRPDLPVEQVDQLRGLVRGLPYTLMAPYPNLDMPIAISAWSAQLKVDQAGDTRLAQFLGKYRQGADTPEPGAPCIGGVGVPIER